MFSPSKRFARSILLVHWILACGDGGTRGRGYSGSERAAASPILGSGGVTSAATGDAATSISGQDKSSGGDSGGGGHEGKGESGASQGGATEAGGGAAGQTNVSGKTCAGRTSGVEASKTIHVSPEGLPSNDGTSFDSPMDFSTALAQVAAGEMILLLPGNYSVAYTEGVGNSIVLDKSGESGKSIGMVAADCGRAVFDFSFPERAWVQNSFGFNLKGSYWYLEGIDVTRAGYQGVYVSGQYNTFENCAFYANRNSGLEINKGGAYNTVINCDAYRNFDPKKHGSMADGFAPKQTQGPGNRFIGCRAWENSDDGFDVFDSPEIVTFESCWAFRNGIDIWNYGNFTGNGNGFKAGGNYKQANHQLTRCVAFANRMKGFDQNNNSGGISIHNSTSYGNGTNFGLGNPLNPGQQHELRNNISLGATDTILNASEQNNSWNLELFASDADFASLDVSLAMMQRNPDGSLPETGLFRLIAGSHWIDAGVDVGLPYAGSAPDLGAFESAP